jgi:hypothetical protein
MRVISLKTCTFSLLNILTKMKKIVFIAICTLGIMSITSCRSTSSSCGLAENTSTKQTQQNFQQTTVVTKVTVK